MQNLKQKMKLKSNVHQFFRILKHANKRQAGKYC